jgi:hypothetical protein
MNCPRACTPRQWMRRPDKTTGTLIKRGNRNPTGQ